MDIQILTNQQLRSFQQQLAMEERELGTIEKYMREVKKFALWQGRRKVTKETVSEWKEQLRQSGYKPETVNGKLSAVNKFLSCMGWGECCVKYLKIQRRLFRSTGRELTKDEYTRLVETAQSLGKTRLALLIETICATGIRVSEVKYITAEALRAGGRISR